MPDEWIRQWGDPVLHEVASPVTGVDDVLLAQAARMARRLECADGAGLAATQVGFLRRLFVYRLSADGPVDTLVNPRVVAASRERSVFLEGCLSYQAVTVMVERPEHVRVEAFSLDGRSLTIEAEGLEASLVQHEIDHLDGILTLDRAEPDERRRALAVLVAGSTPALRAA